MPRSPETYPFRLDVRLTEDQDRAIRRAAEVSGVSLSDWIRSTLIRQARKEVRDATR